MTRDSRCLQHTFSSPVQLKKKITYFRLMELDSWLSSKLKKTTYLLAFLQF